MKTTYKTADIHYWAKGNGNPLVLLHGFLESRKIWQDLSTRESKNRQVICIDLPGHGESGCFADIHSMEDMAEAVFSVLRELEISKADFLGHSMGGYVALAFLEKYPELARKLILLNSTPAADSPERKENRERAVEVVRRNKDAFVSMAISNLLTPENNKKFRTQIQALKEEAKTFSVEGITAALKGMKIRTDRIALLREYSGEKFILAGEQDPILDCKEIKDLAQECGCRFISFPDGHLSYLENKSEFKQFVHFIE